MTADTEPATATATATATTTASTMRAGVRRVRLPSISLTHFGIPLGISGLAGVWTAAQVAIGASTWVADVIWIVATAIWAFFGVLYVLQRLPSPKRFGAELRHPVIGPFAAYVPIIGLLLLTHYGRYLGNAAPWVAWVLVAAALGVAARLLAHWLTGDLAIDHLHPGYFLPVVAGAFVGSIAFSSTGQVGAAAGAFGIGVFFWAVIGTIVTNRLITRGPLPPQLRPTLSVLLVPPAVGGIAWLLLDGGIADAIGSSLIGITIVLFVVQLLLIPAYLTTPVSMTYWTFTFPVAASANLGLRWLTASPFPGSEPLGWVIVVLASALVLAIALATALASARARRPAESGRVETAAS